MDKRVVAAMVVRDLLLKRKRRATKAGANQRGEGTDKRL